MHARLYLRMDACIHVCIALRCVELTAFVGVCARACVHLCMNAWVRGFVRGIRTYFRAWRSCANVHMHAYAHKFVIEYLQECVSASLNDPASACSA